MDYHVFLLSRIKERFDQTRDNAESVAYGLRTTGGLITGAAAIMVAVFGGFAAGDLVPLQQAGFGLAVAVLIDATLVRSVLVPASMKLLGDRNWYLPAWLEWLPKLNIEGDKHEPSGGDSGGPHARACDLSGTIAIIVEIERSSSVRRLYRRFYLPPDVGGVARLRRRRRLLLCPPGRVDVRPP